MAILPTDLSFVLSGGINNDDPNLSLGGFPSPAPMPDTLNNLFSDITSTQASVGRTDYRCIYIFNDNADEPMYECTVYTTPTILESSTPSTVLIGMVIRDEIQTISLTPLATGSLPPDSGSFRLEIDSLQTDLITYTANNTILAANMETAFKAIMEDDVTIDYAGTVDNVKNFTVTFYGINKNKAFGVIDYADNTITPAHSIAAAKSVIGSPINTVAPDIGVDTSVPTAINFTLPSTSGLSIGTLRASEGFPLWIKRTVPSLAENLVGDGIKLRVKVKTSPGI